MLDPHPFTIAPWELQKERTLARKTRFDVAPPSPSPRPPHQSLRGRDDKKCTVTVTVNDNKKCHFAPRRQSRRLRQASHLFHPERRPALLVHVDAVVAALEHGRHVVDVTYAHLDYRAVFIQAVGGDQRQRVLGVVATQNTQDKSAA